MVGLIVSVVVRYPLDPLPEQPLAAEQQPAQNGRAVDNQHPQSSLPPAPTARAQRHGRFARFRVGDRRSTRDGIADVRAGESCGDRVGRPRGPAVGTWWRQRNAQAVLDAERLAGADRELRSAYRRRPADPALVKSARRLAGLASELLPGGARSACSPATQRSLSSHRSPVHRSHAPFVESTQRSNSVSSMASKKRASSVATTSSRSPSRTWTTSPSATSTTAQPTEPHVP